jgi:hypothetical protein
VGRAGLKALDVSAVCRHYLCAFLSRSDPLTKQLTMLTLIDFLQALIVSGTIVCVTYGLMHVTHAVFFG